ncbi:MAG: glycosyltransferase 87 family protein, partial [Candidatus Omnitrophota bacterium]
PSKLAYSGVVDVYSYINANFPAERIWSYYPPMTHLFLGACQYILKSFNPGFYVWIQEVYTMGLGEWLITNGTSFDVLRYLFFMKLPYIIFDGVCLYSIFRYLDSNSSRKQALRLWSINPVILYGIYAFGQIDLIPAALTALAILMVKEKKTWLAFLILSIAALFKTFTIFLIVPFIIVLTDSRKDLLKNLIAAIVPFVLIFVPFCFSGGKNAINSLFPVFYVNPSSDVLWYAVQKVIFIGFYAVLIFACFKLKKDQTGSTPLRIAIAVLMLIYILFFVPIHYFVWVIPLLITAVCVNIVPEWLYWIQIVCLFLYNLNSANTTTCLMLPIDPDFFSNLPGLPDIMHGFSIRWGAIMLGARLVFTALCLLIAMGMIGRAPAITKYFIKNNK